jgi:hypothetical protein
MLSFADLDSLSFCAPFRVHPGTQHHSIAQHSTTNATTLGDDEAFLLSAAIAISATRATSLSLTYSAGRFGARPVAFATFNTLTHQHTTDVQDKDEFLNLPVLMPMVRHAL